MYIPDKNLFIAEIPKTGSKTLAFVAKRLVPNVMFEGHATLKDTISLVGHNVTTLAVIREPKDRLVSSIRYIYEGGDKEEYIDKTINNLLTLGDMSVRHKRALGIRASFVFMQQSAFIEGSSAKDHFFLFDELEEVIRTMGWTGMMPHINKTESGLEKDMVLAHPRLNKVMGLYDRDVKLYEYMAMCRDSGISFF